MRRGRVCDLGCDDGGRQRPVRAVVAMQLVDVPNRCLRGEERTDDRRIEMTPAALA